MSHQHGKLRHPLSRIRRWLGRAKHDESGLTTLEWLLIVAAVAGLAALAVVLVQNVVDDTSEQISGSSARVTAAQIAAQAIVDDAKRESAKQPSGAKNYGDWKKHYKSKCDRLEITYGDANISTESNFGFGTKSGTAILDTAPVKAADFATTYKDSNNKDVEIENSVLVSAGELTVAQVIAQCIVSNT